MNALGSIASWLAVAFLALLCAIGLAGLAPIMVVAALLGILVAAPPLRRLAVVRATGFTTPLRVSAATLVLLFFAFLGGALRFDKDSVAQRSAQIAGNRAAEAAKAERAKAESARQKAAEPVQTPPARQPDAAELALADSAKYRSIALQLQSQLRPGSGGATECDQDVRKAYAMSWEQHRQYTHTYWKKAADLCNVYVNGGMLD